MIRKPLSFSEKAFLRSRRRRQCRDRWLKAACIFAAGVLVGQLIMMSMTGII